MTPLRAGIVGGGWIARVHVPAIDAADGVELVAACDIDRAKAEAIAGPRGAQAYERWEEMLERERLDVLWVCTPPLHHRDPVLAALAAGIHVYLEKPIARTMDDAEAIVAAASAGPGDLRRRLPVACHGAAGRRARGAGRAAGGDAGRPQLRAGRRAAVVHGPGAGRRPDPGAGQPPHRPAARHRRRDRGGRGDRRLRAARPAGRGGVDRRLDLAGVPLRRRRAGLRCTASGRATGSPSCTRPTCWPRRQRSRWSSARRRTG